MEAGFVCCGGGGAVSMSCGLVTGNCRREGLIDGMTGGIDSTLRAQGQMMQLGGEEKDGKRCTYWTHPAWTLFCKR